MKKAIYTLASILCFGIVSAQQDPQRTQPDAKTKTTTDTATILRNTNPENIKKSDAVKTDDHKKITPKNKSNKDTIASKKRKP